MYGRQAGIEYERQIELLKEYFLAMAKDYGYDNYQPHIRFEGNTFTIFDPNFPQSDYFGAMGYPIDVVVKENGELEADHKILSVLFLANNNDLWKVHRYYESYYQCRSDYNREVYEARAQGHKVERVNPHYFNLNFCTLVCHARELGKYYIHTDDGDCRVSRDPRWGASVGNGVVCSTDAWCISLSDLKEQWL